MKDKILEIIKNYADTTCSQFGGYSALIVREHNFEELAEKLEEIIKGKK
jgi:hypothetical protein